MSCDVGHRRGLDLAFLLLWCRPATTAPLQPLAWEPPYTVGVALKGPKKKKKKKFHSKTDVLEEIHASEWFLFEIPLGPVKSTFCFMHIDSRVLILIYLL